MKTINETFTDEEYEGLVNNKDDLSWHDYILQLIDRGDKYDKENKNQRRGIHEND
jgi:predicted CopG family antitoxin